MPVEIERALANLPKDGIVLVYGALLNDELALWRIDAGGSIRICPLEIKGREVIRLKLDMLSILSNPTDQWKADARELYEQLVVPAGRLNAGSELIIVASGALSQIPFEILGENDDDRLLLSHPVVYANTICRSREFNPRSGEVRQRDFGRPIVVSSTSSNRPGIEQEGRIVAEKLGVNLLKSPSKEEFLAAISNAEIVHVASHGSFNSENPFMSYLLINPDEKVEGWELFSVGPRAKLLVFSACNTQTTNAALFRSQNAESFASFGLSGGPKWILGSLWQAEDAPTANLMQVFYSEMGSRFSDPTRPLQIAKKQMLSKGFTAHDFAGFILAVPDVEFLAKQP
jgi:CHAT domain-containing protein